MNKFSLTFLISITLMLWMPVLAMAQNTVIKGQVTDANGESLPAVVVYEEGRQSNGTVTDESGNYTITVPESAKLVFSCLGYEETTRSVPKRGGVLNVRLEEADLRLDAAEVVETGYGSIARRDLAGSISSADMASTLKTNNFNFDQGLIGRIAGVDVTTSDGDLGSTASITIRGNNSLTQSNEPLYVIDGFPTESNMANSINMEDIASIDVLKDASATALYGARGSNGVIVITTKSGVTDKPQVSFSASWTASHISNKMELMNGYDFVELQIEQGQTIYTSYNNETWTLEDYRDVPYTDWQDLVFRTAFSQKYNVSVRGGNKNTGTRYNVSFSAVDQDGIMINSSFEKYQGRVKLTQKIGKKVELDVNVNYARSVRHGLSPTDYADTRASGWFMYSLWGYRPLRPLWDDTDDDAILNQLVDDDQISTATDYRFNPVLSAKNEYHKLAQNNLLGQATLNYSIIHNLVLKVSGSYNYRDTRQETFNNSQTRTGWDGSWTGYGPNGSMYWHKYVDWTNEDSLTWTKDIRSAHHINLQGVFTMSGETHDYYGFSVTHVTSEELGLLGSNTGEYQTVTPYERDWRLMSGMIRLQYNYRHKYLLTASMRADGSSKFYPTNRWGYFPSAALAWTFSNERLIEEKASWLSNGKLRVSWGMTGNNRTDTPYDYYAIIRAATGSTSSRDYIDNGQRVIGYYPSNMENENLKWETTSQFNVGLDLSFLKGKRINFTADFYVKSTHDLLLDADLPPSSGFTSALLNVGSMRNTGLELSLETVNFNKKNFQWTTSINIAFNRNIVTALARGENYLFSSVSWASGYNSEYCYITEVGKPTGMFYGFIYEGTYKADDFDNKGHLKEGIPYLEIVGKDNVLPGDPKYADINGDGVVDDNDYTIIGRGQPVHTGGFNNTFSFYGFDINVFFSWRYGNNILNANRLIMESGDTNNLNQFKSYTKRYNAITNPDSDIPAVGANGMVYYSSRVIEDGSFLKLRNVSVGYTLPSKALEKMKISSLRVYVSGNNLWTITKYSGPDPETSIKSSVLTPGFDWSAYPRAYEITGGISLTF